MVVVEPTANESLPDPGHQFPVRTSTAPPASSTAPRRREYVRRRTGTAGHTGVPRDTDGPGRRSGRDLGPAVTVETFASETEAMACVNDVPYGLAESVSTESARRHSHSLVAQPDFGTVWVNSHLAPTNEVPWGAFEGSDYGRDLAVAALEDFSRTNHVLAHQARRAVAQGVIHLRCTRDAGASPSTRRPPIPRFKFGSGRKTDAAAAGMPRRQR
jgi:hypothetical protein